MARPGIIDLQVNGGGDVLFNDQPTLEGARAIASAHRKFGTTGLSPTLITDSTEKMRPALEAAAAAIGRIRRARRSPRGALSVTAKAGRT